MFSRLLRKKQESSSSSANHKLKLGLMAKLASCYPETTAKAKNKSGIFSVPLGMTMLNLKTSNSFIEYGTFCHHQASLNT